VKIDKLDLKLILELENNSRQSLSKISKKLKASQQLISYRLIKLLEKKIIKKFITFINYYLLGFKNYKVYLKLNTNSKKLKEIINYLKTKKYINYICECCNNYDLIIEFISKDTFDFNNKFIEFRKLYFDYFKNHLILETFEKYNYSKDYLDKRYRNLNTINNLSLCNSNIIKLKEIDNKILDILKNNSKISSVEICNKLDIEPTYFINTFNKLKNEKIILKPTLFLDFNKLNLDKFKILIKLKNLNTDNFNNNIISYLKNNLNVICISKTIGCFDLEVTFELKSKEDFLENLKNLKNKFYKNIDDLEIITIFCEHKYFF
jgi:Lrp/AsnC family transcriptional regulator, leucine-responsive regulatory protein